jgi:hypothetical protein
MQQFIQTDNNTYLNMAKIRWLKLETDRFEICMKDSGCHLGSQLFPKDTHTVSKIDNLASYNMLYQSISQNTVSDSIHSGSD